MPLCRQQHYDIVIVGAGMVGASLACILDGADLARPLRILLVESSPIDLKAPPAQPSFDARSTVLSHGTVSYLRALGLWEALAESAEAIKKIHISDQGRFGAVRLNHTEQGVDALGHVIENRLLGAAFNDSLTNAKTLEVCSDVRVTAVRPQASGMQVELENNEEQCCLETALVVMAEGGRSGLCEKLGITRQEHQYGQQAIIANVAFGNAHDNVAFERFTPSGPLALLPLPDLDGQHRAALVWTKAQEEADNYLALSEAEFLARLQAEFGSRLGRFTRAGRRHAYPLTLTAADEQVRPGLVLLGNVAHSLHPVAGQGFNLAFRDTMRLASLLMKGVRNGQSPGDYALLKQYRHETLPDQDNTVAFSHYMTRLFSTDNRAAAWVRKFGMASIDLVLPLRLAFGRRAMGVAGSRVSLEGLSR